MKAKVLLWLMPMALLTVGCPHNEYVVELTPKGDGLERRLTCWRVDAENPTNKSFEAFPAEELKKIQGLYPEYRALADSHHVFTGVFTNAMPQDVGGEGRVQRVVTSLGVGWAYNERFRGSDDVFGQLEQRTKAADLVADNLVGWLKSELGREPHWPDLERFLQGQVRHDIKNFSMHSYLEGRQGDSGLGMSSTNEPTLLARGLQYIDEHGYLSPAERTELLSACLAEGFPNWFTQFFRPAPGSGGDPEEMRWLQSWLAGRLLLSADAPTLAFARDGSSMSASFERYQTNSPFYEQYRVQWRQAHPNESATNVPNADEAWGEVVGKVISKGGTPDDVLTVKLSLPAEPLQTNGKWDPQQKMLTWTNQIESGEAIRQPVQCFALWVVPDEAFQKTHFGGVVLCGPELGRYISCRALLDAKAGSRWDAFLAKLDPTPNVAERVSSFPSEEAEVGECQEILGGALLRARSQPGK
jgi:hypothetical protein